jgi:phage tail sheath protein FI
VNSPTIDLARPATPNNATPPENLPAKLAATALAHGADDDLGTIQAKHFKDGIDALQVKTDVNLLCVPDRTDQDVQSYMIAHCERLQDRFAILDSQRNAVPFDGSETQRGNLTSLSGYAALYYPWISISNPTAPGQILVPPSGHVAGVFARVDDSRGVHKAPANEGIRGALALERELTDADQGTLNDKGINVIRRFPDIGILIWARARLRRRPARSGAISTSGAS